MPSAERWQRRLTSLVQEYDFTLPNARSRKLHFASDQLVVVGSPVYGGVMPLLVREYLAQYVTGEKTACILAGRLRQPQL